jgi:hypothetical protein
LAFAFVTLGTGEATSAAGALALATAASIVLTVLASATLGVAALHRSAAGKRVSGTGLPLAAMLIGTALYLALAYWAGIAALPIG